MNLQRLRVFDMVVRTGSVTRAAERLHVSQPAVTSQLKALEAHYEVSLFRRAGRRLAPTALGEALAEVSGRLFALEEDAVALLERGQQLKSGTLRLASDGPYLAIPIVRAFRSRFPGVRVSLTILNTQAVQSALLAEHVDVTIQSHSDDDERLYAIPIARLELIGFVAADHPWARSERAQIDFAELNGVSLVVREPGSTTRRVLDDACASTGVEPLYVIETTSRETVKEAVAAGLGVGVIAENEFRTDPRLWPLRVTGADLHYSDEVLCLNRRRDLRAVREFLILARSMVESGELLPDPSSRPDP